MHLKKRGLRTRVAVSTHWARLASPSKAQGLKKSEKSRQQKDDFCFPQGGIRGLSINFILSKVNRTSWL
jgi:hypothetical protein